MRRLLLLSAIVITLLGCAAVKEQSGYIKLCMADIECRNAAIAKANETKDVAGQIGDMVPIPLSNKLVGGIAGGLALLIFAARLGKKKANA